MEYLLFTNTVLQAILYASQQLQASQVIPSYEQAKMFAGAD